MKLRREAVLKRLIASEARESREERDALADCKNIFLYKLTCYFTNI